MHVLSSKIGAHKFSNLNMAGVLEKGMSPNFIYKYFKNLACPFPTCAGSIIKNIFLAPPPAAGVAQYATPSYIWLNPANKKGCVL